MAENAYSKAGVDVEAGYQVVERIKKHVARTERMGAMGALGSFGGMFDLSSLHLKEPVLVSGTDGVGTKLLLAIEADKHDTIGIDCVAMCVNDILAQGAEPLFFLDYIATGKTDPVKMEQIVKGVADGCEQAGAALIGGETAEMPDMYGADDYDLAGFTVGAVEKQKLIIEGAVKAGDTLIGIPSSGIHSNGYSLVRKIFFKDNEFTLDAELTELGVPLVEELLKPTRIYVKPVLEVLKQVDVHGITHVTGGGFVENLPRMLTTDLAVKVELGSWPMLPIFDVMKKYGQLKELEMYEIFNMGIGMVLAVANEDVEKTLEVLVQNGEAAYVIGEVTTRESEAVIFAGGKKG
ncbi:phosphoribosylformylglycinamidine cyclo-ligase [Listeria cossartiae subsp. cayugensis]|uniref:Phosphoribosylformylglycinamidine cyclo-ligase n=1 Tax=Listeria cossartiae subsp. cayugensis TaxID=2713505 RepID=A0ABU2ISW7_9LIST|nr:phosphoribosylformylglycinamidine cyclo-ligase [Listeria cossartiae]MDT0050670.1 phosphoribosylformylglycinamidine cyclo-ligase [Listeria cossartiae subsp. cayugensis]MDT0067243.1 phosphoribosylformylglycinamidine cyclo-ligase [Listeria cossartiae subsp. cayugensis]MDT0081061.1 phosphoribosylformylglycinamidine cyclo-ligase [Listeria cossartiae subsp. cayugensis]MDT0083968.1 phosphoribosylformylglycinamidine cyclo-ligase [Listeria cossartiae subsp. cayugensis]MDT0089476.1 phosphoribosylform